MQDLSLPGTSNGDLFARLKGGHDVFVTADKNLRYQQNLTGRTLAIVEVPANRWPILTAMSPEVFIIVPDFGGRFQIFLLIFGGDVMEEEQRSNGKFALNGKNIVTCWHWRWYFFILPQIPQSPSLRPMAGSGGVFRFEA